MNPYTIKRPVVTEKSLLLAQKENKYTFEVKVDATKDQIVSAVRELFGVEVLDVKTIKLQPKKKRTGKRRVLVSKGKTKKAIISVAQGQTIDLFDFGGDAQS